MIDWTGIARELGYAGTAEMFKDLYVAKKNSLVQLANRFAVSQNSIRKALESSGVEIRARGGPNNLKVLITEDLLKQVSEKGIQTVAKELEVDPTTLYKKLYYKYGVKLRELPREAPPDEPEQSPETEGTNRDDNR